MRDDRGAGHRVSMKASGGETGIRTPGTLSRSTVFKTAAFDHSATSPLRRRFKRSPRREQEEKLRNATDTEISVSVADAASHWGLMATLPELESGPDHCRQASGTPCKPSLGHIPQPLGADRAADSCHGTRHLETRRSGCSARPWTGVFLPSILLHTFKAIHAGLY